MAENTPAVSVVIPLYNKGPYIARALNSVLTQTFQDFEVIVVDDGSTDDGAEVVRKFDDPRIRLIQQENGGASRARNKGVNEAKAELIAFLDADDEWASKHLETISKLRIMFPEAGAYVTSYIIHTSDMEIKMPLYVGIPKAPWEGLIPSFFVSSALGCYPVNSSVLCVPKNIFFEVKGFPEGIWWGEDEYLWGNIALKYQYAFSWELGAIYHYDASERVSNRSVPFEEHEFIKLANKLITDNNISPNLKQDLDLYITSKEIDRAIRHIINNRSSEARLILRNCSSNSFRIKKYLILFLSYLPYTINKKIEKNKEIYVKLLSSINKIIFKIV